MLRYEEAVAVLTEHTKKITETEMLPILMCGGRVLAKDQAAEYDQPPFPRSPLDGYAVRGEDTEGASSEKPAILRVVGKTYAGGVYEKILGEGEAVRIMTGAPIPAGANAVIMQEKTNLGTETVEIYQGVKPWQNYCYQGEDYKKGTVLLKEGMALNGHKMALLGSIGKEEVPVYRLPRIAVISSGDEVVEPGETLLPGKIFNSNRFLVTGRLMELGITPVFSKHIADDAEVIADTIKELSDKVDLIITTGGVSVGEKDIMHDVVKLIGAKQLFWKVAVKPGTPTIASMLGDIPVICLTGNPFGVAVNFELLCRPVIAKMTGNPAWNLKKHLAVMNGSFAKGGKINRYVRGYVEEGVVRPVEGNHSSGALASLAYSNCLIEILPREGGVEKGEEIWVYDL